MCISAHVLLPFSSRSHLLQPKLNLPISRYSLFLLLWCVVDAEAHKRAEDGYTQEDVEAQKRASDREEMDEKDEGDEDKKEYLRVSPT